jgi:hypothetical protein
MEQPTRSSLTLVHVLCGILLVATAVIAAWYTNQSIWLGLILVIVVFAVLAFSGQRLERWFRGAPRAPSEKSRDRQRPRA